MIWQSWDAFWAMGGYGRFVWGSFGVSALLIALELALLARQGKQTRARLRRWLARRKPGEAQA